MRLLKYWRQDLSPYRHLLRVFNEIRSFCLITSVSWFRYKKGKLFHSRWQIFFQVVALVSPLSFSTRTGGLRSHPQAQFESSLINLNAFSTFSKTSKLELYWVFHQWLNIRFLRRLMWIFWALVPVLTISVAKWKVRCNGPVYVGSCDSSWAPVGLFVFLTFVTNWFSKKLFITASLSKKRFARCLRVHCFFWLLLASFCLSFFFSFYSLISIFHPPIIFLALHYCPIFLILFKNILLSI